MLSLPGADSSAPTFRFTNSSRAESKLGTSANALRACCVRCVFSVVRRSGNTLLFSTILGCLLLSSSAWGHDFNEHDISVECDVAVVGGTLTLPAHEGENPGNVPKNTCVVIVGGTLSQTRDGGLERPHAPSRDALKRLAQQLAVGGYSSIRYDKVGFGSSQAKPNWEGTYLHESQVAAAMMTYAKGLDGIEHVAAIGESAGAYLVCLAAQRGVQADGYVFLGGHCDSGPAIYEYNFGRLLRLAEADAAWKAFAEDGHLVELALGQSYREMFEAASSGKTSLEVCYGDFSTEVGLARRKEELEFPPDEMFRFIRMPALALSGEYDLNVPPNHAAKIVHVLRKSGNHRCTCITIPGCDHSFQLSPDDRLLRLRERYDFESFKRPYSARLYREINGWLDQTFGATGGTELLKQNDASPTRRRAVETVERDPKTEATPARIHLAPGIQIIDDITDKTQTTGVETLEGEIGPLLLAAGSQAHFIDMPAGMYCEEHPHSSESIIFTVRGRWVLCSDGRRHVMQAGSLFHFAANTPTGYEVPFDEGAYILIFKGDRIAAEEASFIRYLKGLAQRLEREHQAGVPYLLSDLPENHAAIRFAHQVNPEFKP